MNELKEVEGIISKGVKRFIISSFIYVTIVVFTVSCLYYGALDAGPNQIVHVLGQSVINLVQILDCEPELEVLALKEAVEASVVPTFPLMREMYSIALVLAGILKCVVIFLIIKALVIRVSENVKNDISEDMIVIFGCTDTTRQLIENEKGNKRRIHIYYNEQISDDEFVLDSQNKAWKYVRRHYLKESGLKHFVKLSGKYYKKYEDSYSFDYDRF